MGKIQSKLNKIPLIGKIIILLLFIITIILIYSESLSTTLKQNYLNQLTETANYNNSIIHGELKDKQTTLQQIASFIEDSPNMVSKENMQKLSEISKQINLKRIGIIYPDKRVFVTDNLGQQSIYLDDIGIFFEKSLKDKESITRIEKDKIDDSGAIIVMSIPLKNNNGELKGILFATYDVNTLRNFMTLDIFNGKGYSIIMNSKGEKLITSLTALKLDSESNNIFYNLERINSSNKDIIERMKADVEANKSGIIQFNLYEKMYMSYQPLGIDDLYILTVIPKNIIENQYNILMKSTYFLCIGLSVALFIIMMNIIFNEKRKKRLLENITYVDKVTGGYSYEKFLLEYKKKQKNNNRKKAFIILDIDNFKLINDIFGYNIGNMVLKDVWKIIYDNLKQNGIFARKYADKYSIMIFFDKEEEIIEFVDKVIKDIEQVNIIKREKFRIVPSIGIYILENNDEKIDQIENYAIMASRTIKNRYDVYYSFYYNKLKSIIIEKKNMTDSIYQALENKSFIPYFQPKFDAKTKKIVGAEALIRWQKEDGSFVSPVKFIPIAEEVGIIAEIDKYMFEAVCKQQCIWKTKGLKILPISVNLSRNKLYNANFIDEYMSILSKYKLEPKDIQFEITEGTLYTEEKIGEKIIMTLKNLGFDILIDDFGVGYSSISMIRDINATEMKIDKSFIDDTSERGKALTNYVIKIAEVIGMKTVAEGVETKEQYEFLLKHNCDIIQGYYFAKPMPAKEYEKFL
jgi:diguanylate cyclase (GGDEF)-like protein